MRFSSCGAGTLAREVLKLQNKKALARTAAQKRGQECPLHTQTTCTIFVACKSTRFSTAFHSICSCVTCLDLRIMAAKICYRRLSVSVYSRADLLRILHVTPRQLINWERVGLVSSAEAYSFSDLLEIKKVRDLCAMSVRPAVIRQSLDAMRKQASGVEKPLLEAGAWSTAKHRVAFRHDGKLLEPIAGQFLMDFSEREKVVTSTPVPKSEPTPRRPRSCRMVCPRHRAGRRSQHAGRGHLRISPGSRD